MAATGEGGSGAGEGGSGAGESGSGAGESGNGAGEGGSGAGEGGSGAGEGGSGAGEGGSGADQGGSGAGEGGSGADQGGSGAGEGGSGAGEGGSGASEGGSGARAAGSRLMMGEKKTSARVPEGAPRRVLDGATRQRRLHRQLEALENDNFGDDPQAGLPRPGKRLPNFSDTAETGKKKKKTRGDHFKVRFRKNFQALLEEQNLSAAEGPNYVSAGAAPSRLPQRHFCAVCGFPSGYTCVTCGARYCCTRCLGTHQDTRCLKWTV